MEQNKVINVATKFAEALKSAKNFEELRSAATKFGNAVCRGQYCLMSDLRNLNGEYLNHKHNPHKNISKALIEALRYAEGHH
jgi:hypothetical protein